MIVSQQASTAGCHCQGCRGLGPLQLCRHLASRQLRHCHAAQQRSTTYSTSQCSILYMSLVDAFSFLPQRWTVQHSKYAAHAKLQHLPRALTYSQLPDCATLISSKGSACLLLLLCLLLCRVQRLPCHAAVWQAAAAGSAAHGCERCARSVWHCQLPLLQEGWRQAPQQQAVTAAGEERGQRLPRHPHDAAHSLHRQAGWQRSHDRFKTYLRRQHASRFHAPAESWDSNNSPLLLAPSRRTAHCAGSAHCCALERLFSSIWQCLLCAVVG